MVRKTTTMAPPRPAALSQEQMRKGIVRLDRRLVELNNFEPADITSAPNPYAFVRPISESIETAIAETFGHGTVEYNRFQKASDFTFSYFGDVPPPNELAKRVRENKTASMQLLSAAIELLRERINDDPDPIEPTVSPTLRSHSEKVFVVHGRDNEPKEAAARFLTSLGLQPIILHEQANKGRTIIQKFRDEAADVGFALVLMTPDDELSNGQKRARQNVILELGFFLGALGPDKVAAIVKGDLERPSDFDGVLYIPFDAGWKIAIAKELQAAGYTVDWNVVMKQ